MPQLGNFMYPSPLPGWMDPDHSKSVQFKPLAAGERNLVCQNSEFHLMGIQPAKMVAPRQSANREDSIGTEAPLFLKSPNKLSWSSWEVDEQGSTICAFDDRSCS